VIVSEILRNRSESGPSYPRLRPFLGSLHLDIPLLVALIVLSGIGLVILYSASEGDTHLLVRQLIHLGVAFVVLVLAAQIPPRQLYRGSPWLFVAGLALLTAVLVAGATGKGAQRWLELGLFRFQPSELMKIAVPMMAAWFVVQKRLPPGWLRVLLAALLIIVPVLMIAKQPDLGTALLVACSGFLVLFLAGLSWRIVAGAGVAIAALAPAAWQFMHDYQRRRILIFLNPESDPLNAGWNTIQAKIAIGSGGIYGKGWLNGTQSHLEFIPERSTDFIFAVLAEEFGLIGVILLVGLYLFIVIRGMYIATRAQDNFSRLLAGSLVLTFFVYVIVNASMVSGLIPVVGVPLPLISYGGTSVVTLLAAFGILMSIQSHRKLLAS
jgi:rod shape determining protein RodA